MTDVRVIGGDGVTAILPTPPGIRLHASAQGDLTIVAASAAMRRAVELAYRFAARDLPILLVGPTGTGKEVLAQAIHRWSGLRGALVDVDCGAIPPGMVASLLFGHRRGAYTGAVESMPGLMEEADGGTVFLDELASLSAEGQAALLRALETGEVRRVGEHQKRRVQVRMVAAVQPAGPVAGGPGLRPDLYQRLAGGVIHLPPLAARVEDVWPLAHHFASHLGRTLTLPARMLLERHPWPGNVRELRLAIARAAILSEAPALDARAVADALGLVGVAEAGDTPVPLAPVELATERLLLEALCREHAAQADAMAAALRVSRATLYRRLRRVGLRLRYGVEDESDAERVR